MISRSRHLMVIAVALSFTAASLAGCGSDEPEGAPIPRSASDELLQQLDSISGRIANGSSGACDDIFEPASAGGNVEAVDRTMASLPDEVDPEVRAALEQSLDRLKQLVDDECAQIAPEEVTEPPVNQETIDTETNDETVPTETETTPPEPVEPTEEPVDPPESPPEPEAPNGRGPDDMGPPGQDRGGAEAPDDDDDD